MAFTAPQQDITGVEEPAQEVVGFTAPQADVISQAEPQTGVGFTAPQTDVQQAPSSGYDFWEGLGYTFGLSFTDSIRGGAQLLGLKENEMKGQQENMNKILDEYGAPAYAAMIAGYILDPVGWALPISRLKHLTSLRHLGKIDELGMGGKVAKEAVLNGGYGAGVGALSYVDENAESLVGEGSMTRLEQAGIGAIAGSIMGPAAKLGSDKWASSKAGEKMWNTVAKPEVAMATVGGGLGGFAGYQSGINEHGEPLLGDLFSEEFVNSGGYAKWRNALAGATVGAAGGRKLGKSKPHWFVPDYGLEESLVNTRVKVKPAIEAKYTAEIEPVAKKINDTISNVAKADQKTASKLLYKMVTDGPAQAKAIMKGLSGDESMDALVRSSPELVTELRALRVDSLRAISKMGKELVEEGILDKRIWLKNKNKYLHRIYNKPGEANKIASQSGYGVIGDELEPRGLVRDVTEADYQKMLRDEPDMAWEKWDVDELPMKERPAEGSVRVRRDWTPEERIKMGENMDILDAFQATGKLLSQDVTRVRYLNDLANMPNVSSTKLAKDKPAAQTAESIGDNARDTRASMSQTPPNAGTWTENHTVHLANDKKYGNLRDKWVSKETADDLKSFSGEGTLNSVMNSDMMKSYQKANSIWKATKTILNPAVHFNNFNSNIMMYDMGVINVGARKWAVLGQAAKALIAKSGKMSDDMAEAQTRGVFGTNLTVELAEGDFAPLAQKIAGSIGSKFNTNMGVHAQKQIEGSISHTSKMLKFMKRNTYDRMAKAYQFEDNVFRLAMYKIEKEKLIQEGMPAAAAMDRAAAKAREHFVDYSRQTPALQALKSVPLPFLSYTYGIIPRLAETAIKHPVKIAKWSAITYLLNEAGAYGSKKSLEDIKETERLMAETHNKRSGIGTLNRIRIPDAVNPFSDDDAYMDITRATPGGMPFAEKKGGVGQIKFLPEAAQPSLGALGGVLFPAMGIDQFRGKEIPEGEKLGAMVRQFTPNILGVPGTYAQNKLDKANTGIPSRYKDDHTPATAAASGFGAKITPVDDRKLRDRIKWNYDAKIDAVKKEERQLKTKRKEGLISDEAFHKKREALRNKKQRIKRNRRKALYGD